MFTNYVTENPDYVRENGAGLVFVDIYQAAGLRSAIWEGAEG